MQHRFTLLAAFLFPIFLSAQTYFVDGANGNDNNNGLTETTAWKTVQKACNDATAGSTVFIRGGNYNEALWMNVTGTPGNYITFTPYFGETAVIDGGSTGAGVQLLNISGSDYIRIDGLVFANATGPYSIGVAIRDGSDYIEVLNCTFHDIHFSNNAADPVNCGSNTNANAFIVYNENALDACTNILFQDNEIYDCRTGCSEACTFNGNTDGFEVRGNLVHDITNIGIDAAGGYGVSPNPLNDFARNGLIAGNIVWNCVSQYAVSAGIYVDGGHDIIIERNTSHDNGRGYEIGCEQQGHVTSGILLRSNVSYHNREAGIGIGGYDFPNTGKVTNCEVRNNTFYNNDILNTTDGELLIEYTENCIVRHNVFSATNAFNRLLTARLNSTGLTLDYNLYHHTAGSSNVAVDWNGTIYTGFAAYQAGSGKDANSPFGNPLFSNAGSANFEPQPGSPTINAGNPAFNAATGETDYAGNTRQINTIDIGAYESQIALPVEYLEPLVATIENREVVLRWSVGFVVNHSHFEVLRSDDGIHFEKIGEVWAQPDNNNFTPYYFIDETPLNGIGYYRLKQFDNDGKYTFSNVVQVKLNNPEIVISPNPSKGFVFVKAAQIPDYYLLTDHWGRQLQSGKPGSDGRISFSSIAPGTYFLQVFYDGDNAGQVQKLILE